MTLALVALATLFGAAPNVGVVVGKRSGVSAPVAAARAASVRSALGPQFADAAVDDFTSCAAKRPCLVKEAQARQWKALVVVETATIISDALVKVTVLSIDDDGREVGATSVQAPDEKLVEVLGPALSKVRGELAKFAPAPNTNDAPMVKVDPPPVEPTPTKPVEPTKPEQTPRVGVVAAPAKPAARWVPASGGLAVLGAGIVFSVASQGLATRLATETFADARTAEILASDGALFQTLGGVLIASGAAVTVAGFLLALLWPEAPVAPMTFITPAGGTLGLVGVFP